MNKYSLSILISLFLFSCNNYNLNSTSQYKPTKIFNNITTKKEMMHCNCHTQGVGWCTKTNQIVVTCQGSDGYSYVVLFPDYSEGQTMEALDVIKTDVGGRKFSHPSAIQIYNRVVPVAITEGKRDSSFIHFYNLKQDKIDNTAIPILKYPKHIGALGLNVLDDKLILIGFGWDSEYFAIWESEENILNFKLVKEGELSELTDDKLAAYNSIWIGTNTLGEKILLASCGSFYSKKKNFIDIFRINYEKNEFSLQKKERIYVNDITKNTWKSLFFEGVTVKEITRDSLKIISAPQDFKKKKDGAVLKYLYEGILITK